jgi:hypothetical protein
VAARDRHRALLERLGDQALDPLELGLVVDGAQFDPLVEAVADLDRAALAASASTTGRSSCSGTKTRLTAMQICPELRNAGQNSFSATSAGSASSRMMAASLPPSSSSTRLRSAAADTLTFLPVAIDPVKETPRGTGCSVIHWPSSLPPETTFSTPAGMSARRISPIRTVTTGVYGDGLRTTVQPARKAGAMVLTAIPIGTFHGLMAAMTPIGRRTIPTRAASSSCTVTRGMPGPAERCAWPRPAARACSRAPRRTPRRWPG